ncbi:hypothetical protein DIRU0_B12926 [Diutina rugosa]
MGLYKIPSAPALRAAIEAGSPHDVSEKLRDLSISSTTPRSVVCPPNTPEMGFTEKGVPQFSLSDVESWRI